MNTQEDASLTQNEDQLQTSDFEVYYFEAGHKALWSIKNIYSRTKEKIVERKRK